MFSKTGANQPCFAGAGVFNVPLPHFTKFHVFQVLPHKDPKKKKERPRPFERSGGRPSQQRCSCSACAGLGGIDLKNWDYVDSGPDPYTEHSRPHQPPKLVHGRLLATN